MPTFRVNIKGRLRDPFCVSGSSITISEHKQRIEPMRRAAYDKKIILAYSANKVRTHWERLERDRKVPKWECEKYKNFPLSYLQRHKRVPKHWEVRVYEFPTAFLSLIGKKVVQHTHHYELVDV